MKRNIRATITALTLLTFATGCGGHERPSRLDADATTSSNPSSYAVSYETILSEGLLFQPDELDKAVKKGLRGDRLLYVVNNALSYDEDRAAKVGTITDGVATCFIAEGRYFQIVGRSKAGQRYLFGRGTCSTDPGKAEHVLLAQPAQDGYPPLFTAETHSATSRVLAKQASEHIILVANGVRSAPSLNRDSKAVYQALMDYRVKHGTFPKPAPPAELMATLNPYGGNLTAGNALAYYGRDEVSALPEFYFCIDSPLKYSTYVNLGTDGKGLGSDMFEGLPGTCAQMR